MGDWIDEEAGKDCKEREELERKEYLRSIATYWADLTSQIKQDVQKIQTTKEWAHIFERPIKVETTDRHGLRIIKTSYPAYCRITIENGGDDVTVTTQSQFHEKADVEHKTETLLLDFNTLHTILTNGKDFFIIPEQAAAYILGPLVKAIKDHVKFMAERNRV